MIKKILFIFFLFVSVTAAQGYVSFNNFKYYDSEVLSLLGKISQDMGADKILVFQTITDTPDKTKELVTFLVSRHKNKVNVRMITSDFIYSIVEIRNSSIFNYKYFEHTGVVSSENQLKSNSSFLNPFNGSDIVLFHSLETNFYFECGRPSTFKEDLNKSRYRKEWAEIIKKELLANINKFKKETLYDRHKGLSSDRTALNSSY